MLIYAICIIMKQILLLFLLCAPAFGRLGETKDECEKRYGKPVFIDGTVARYHKNGFKIVIMFVDDKACSLGFGHIDPVEKISKIERDGIVKANAGNRRVLVIDEGNIAKALHNSEYADFILVTQADDKSLIITDQISSKKIRDQGEAEEKQSVEGF